MYVCVYVCLCVCACTCMCVSFYGQLIYSDTQGSWVGGEGLGNPEDCVYDFVCLSMLYLGMSEHILEGELTRYIFVCIYVCAYFGESINLGYSGITENRLTLVGSQKKL